MMENISEADFKDLIKNLESDSLTSRINVANEIVIICSKLDQRNFISLLEHHSQSKIENSWIKWCLDEIDTIHNRTPEQQKEISALLVKLDETILLDFGGEIPEYVFDYDFWDNHKEIYHLLEKLTYLQAFEVIDYLTKFFKSVYDDDVKYAKSELLKLFLHMKRSSRLALTILIDEIMPEETNDDFYSRIRFYEDFNEKALDVLLEIDLELETRKELFSLLSIINNNCTYRSGGDGFNIKPNDSLEADIGKKIINEIAKRKIEEAIPVLVETLKGSIKILENHAVRALGEIGNEEAIVYLFRLLWKTTIQTYYYDFGALVDSVEDSDNQRLEREAKITLGKLGIKLDGVLLKKILLNILTEFDTWSEENAEGVFFMVKKAIGDYTIYEKDILDFIEISFKKYKDDPNKRWVALQLFYEMPIQSARSLLLEISQSDQELDIRELALEIITFIECDQ